MESIHSLTGSIIPDITFDKIRTYNPQSIADNFGEFYSTLGEKLASTIKPGTVSIDSYLDKIPRNLNSLVMRWTTSQKVEKLIDLLPHNASSGYDGISNVMLKSLSKTLSYLLALTFNQSLEQGVFPSTMKTAEVIPLYKGKERDKVINYRPISLLMTMSKILEKIVYKTVFSFLEHNDIPYESQYGFRSKRSCEKAITELVSNILQAKNSNLHSAAVFLDLLESL